jgi:4-diphosphocytidyl-2-C-methyl-D-erythritol kinase
MVLFPNAKINLGLRIIERRKDGYHNIETIFVPVGLCDVLEFVESSRLNTSITVTGINLIDNLQDNLVVKAWDIMHQKYGVPPVDIHLHKAIPVGAGLGGGSSDAAYMLKGLNRYFNCGASLPELEKLADQIGSDCPFFIQNMPAFATGRGELLEHINLPLENHKILLVTPGIHISTREAYESVIPRRHEKSLSELICQPVNNWQNLIFNDFEEPIFAKYPEIEKLKNKLHNAGAIYTAMSGSGSTVFGIYQEIDKKSINQLIPDCFFWLGNLR